MSMGLVYQTGQKTKDGGSDQQAASLLLVVIGEGQSWAFKAERVHSTMVDLTTRPQFLII